MRKAFTIILILIATLTYWGAQNAYAQNEEENQDTLSELLLIQIPDETDNPNFTITFTDPSGEGVELKVDGGKYEVIQNPHTLPALGVGKHTLIFKFIDDQDTEQEIERTLTIVPRPPEINPPENIDNKRLIIAGTAVAAGRVELFLTGGTVSYKESIDVTDTGSWEFVFKDDFKPGIYSAIAYVKKKGLASNYSEPIVFAIETDQQVEGVTSLNTREITGETNFSISSIKSVTDVQNILLENPDLWYVIGGGALVGALLFFLFGRVIAWRLNQVSERDFQKILKNRMKLSNSENSKKKDKKNSSKDIEENASLKAKFESAGFKTDSYTDLDNDDKGERDSENSEDKTPEKKLKKSAAKKLKETKKTERKSQDLDPQSTDKSKKDGNTPEDTTTATDEKTDEESEDEKNFKEGSLSKEEFLKKFKDFKLDREEKGDVGDAEKSESQDKSSANRENDSKKKKDKSIKITLTSGSLKN